MKALRTSDERFEDLPDYPFTANYIELDNLRMHYLDEGPADGKIVLMLHGEPSWSYLYRFMVPVCVAAGHRVIVPDLIGFGKSDKPTEIADYSYLKHMNWLKEFITRLELKNITLVCQDWGSLLGLRLAVENESLFDSIAIGNGMLPTGDEGPLPFAFRAWLAFAKNSPWFPIAKIVNVGTKRSLSKAEQRAYDAPFPHNRYKAGARAFPLLVPIDPNNVATKANRLAWAQLGCWEKPFLTMFSSGDPIMGGLDVKLQQHVPGAKGQPHQKLAGGHFLQEDSGVEFAQAVNQMIARMS